MMQVIEQTREEKMAMYMKMPKRKIAEMLVECNRILDAELRSKNIIYPEEVAKSICSHCGSVPRWNIVLKD